MTEQPHAIDQMFPAPHKLTLGLQFGMAAATGARILTEVDFRENRLSEAA